MSAERPRYWLAWLAVALLLPFPSAHPSNPARLQEQLSPLLSSPAYDVQQVGWSGWPAISADGRFVAYVSTSEAPAAQDTNGKADVYLWDRISGSLQLGSISSNSVQGNGWSYQPAISTDGRYLAFTSLSSNLAGRFEAADANAMADIYLRDRLSGTTARISIALENQSPNGWSHQPSISGDGRILAFSSSASNLVAGNQDQTFDIFVRDWQSGQTELISALDGVQIMDASHPTISQDGRFIAYLASTISGSSQLPNPGVYLYDRLSKTTSPVALPSEDALNQTGRAELQVSPPAISADGSYLAFAAASPAETGIFLYSRRSGQVHRVKTLAFVPQDLPELAQLSMNASGERIALAIWGEDASPTVQVFDWQVANPAAVDEVTLLSEGDFQFAWPSLSADGKWLALASTLGDHNASDPDLPQQSGVVVQDLGNPTGKPFISGWVSDELGLPIAGVTVRSQNGHSASTDRFGSFTLENIPPSTYVISPDWEGFEFSPDLRRVRLIQDTANGLSPVSAVGLAFTARPQGVLEAARLDIGMPYALVRGCPSPFEPCDGPFHGFFSGDCTDLVMDAYRVGLQINLQDALQLDFLRNPRHYYRWQNARSSQDMWRYFVYTGQLLPPDHPYLPGDIVFFDWEGDAQTDHVAIISSVNQRAQPTKIIDATGVIADNPGGLAVELDWKFYHDQRTTGHARWLGSSAPRLEQLPLDTTLLLVALDSPEAHLRLLDLEGRAISSETVQIPGGVFQAASSSQVASAIQPLENSEWYFVELSSPESSAFQLGIQTIASRLVTSSHWISGTLQAGEELVIPLKLKLQDDQLKMLVPGY